MVGAVVASASYPFLFKPTVDIEERLLADGGLASNLPAFLYAAEFRRTRWPIFAFDLVSAGSGGNKGKLMAFCGRMLTTALEASDALLADAIPGVHLIEVKVPEDIHTLKFELSDDEICRLYDVGYRAASEFLNNYQPWRDTRLAGEDLKRSLLINYGPPAQIQPILWALVEMVKQKTSAEALRAAVMLPTGRGTRIVTYTFGFRNLDTDTDLEIKECHGVTGQALRTQGVVVADMSLSSRSESWDLTQEQARLVPPDRRSMICVPLRIDSRSSLEQPAATLSVDSSTDLKHTDWLGSESSSAALDGDPRVAREIVEVMEEWSRVVGRILFP